MAASSTTTHPTLVGRSSPASWLPRWQAPSPVASRTRVARELATTDRPGRGCRAVMPAFEHEPVLLGRILDLFAAVPDGIFVDATLGGAGHAAALLEAHPGFRLVGIDRDPAALDAAAERLAPYAVRCTFHHARYDRAAALARAEADATGLPVVAALFDLGVSSPQLDRAERGFSYRHDAPLDMRMDPTAGPTAADVVNGYDEARLAEVLATLGDERFSARIARAIVAARPITSTVQLAELVREAIPAATRRRGGHPAKRTFQAIRIEVNEELTILSDALDTVVGAVDPGGRVAVISYHSGEDRLVKAAFRLAVTGGCTCPPDLPCVCGAMSVARNVTRGGITPDAAELEANPRAASARLRAVERIVEEPFR